MVVVVVVVSDDIEADSFIFVYIKSCLVPGQHTQPAFF